MLLEKLNKLNLPPLQSREQMLHAIQEYEFGFIPEKPEKIRFTVEENVIPKFCAGNAVCNKVTAHCTVNGKEFSFPFYANIPVNRTNIPFFIHVNFRPDNPDRYMPTEEIIDNGFAVFSVYYEDITSDDGDFTDKLAGILFDNGKREKNSPGKSAMWAWASHRIMDYAYTLGDVLDLSCGTVCGHSRLGKTALFAAATDERFFCGYSNDSGCSGASLARGTTGETVQDICDRFPFWFCENYYEFASNEEAMPFDQHYLLGAITPRKVLIGSASLDAWADPVAEFMCCYAASDAFPKGFACENRLPVCGDEFLEGDIGYHQRYGMHYFSRLDWQKLIKFVNLHRE